jgi:tetratricopeptide (TPR) repeat protein
MSEEEVIAQQVDELLAEGRIDEAERLLTPLDRDQGWVEALWGDIAVEREDDGEACERYVRALRLGVDDVALRLGNLLAERGDIVAAEAAYRHAAERGEPMAWRNLALTIEETDPVAAERYFRTAIANGDSRSALLLGEMLVDAGRPEDAAPVLRAALESGETEAAIALGLLLAQSGRDDEALRVFEVAVATEAEPVVVPFLGAHLVAHGKQDEAEALYRATLRVHPEAGDVLLNLANILSESDDERHLREAEELYRRAIAAGVVEAHNNLGVLLEGEGRAAEAARAFGDGAALGDEVAARNAQDVPAR